MSGTPEPPVAANETIRVVHDATCTACGCMCDDLRLQVETSAGGAARIVAMEPACPLGEQWFLKLAPQGIASCLIDGMPVPWEQGCRRAAEILSRADAPLIFGLEQSTCETQRLAVAIADSLGGQIDPTTYRCRSNSHVAVQTVGLPTATLGEVATRGDLLLYWFADPLTTHPRHFDRIDRLDRRLPNGVLAPRREVIVVDAVKTATANRADCFLQVDRSAEFESLGVLRGLVAGVEQDSVRVEHATGLELSCWQDLATRLKRAAYGAIFHAPRQQISTDLHADDLQAEAQAVLELARDLNEHTRCVALGLGRPDNAVGAQQVLTWQTGFPAAVDFSLGYPRYLPGEASADKRLARGEADAALAIGCDPWLHLEKPASDAAGGCFDSIPLLAIDCQETETTRRAAVAFHVARYGIETGGSVYRSDGVPLPLRPALRSQYPTAEAVLQVIALHLQELC